MHSLTKTADALCNCLFYVENMINMQHGNVLATVPKSTESRNPRAICEQIKYIAIMFDNYVSPTLLNYSPDGLIFRFRAIYDSCVAANAELFLDDGARSLAYAYTKPLPNPVPVRVASEPAVEFAARYLHHTACQVAAYDHVMRLDPYAHEHVDYLLPEPFPEVGTLHDFKKLDQAALLCLHGDLTRTLSHALLDAHDSRTPYVRAYGKDVLFLLLAKCRSAIFAGA